MRLDDQQLSHPEGAELQCEASQGEWILRRLLPWGSKVGTRVCSVVPSGYEAYVRLFHSVYDGAAPGRVRRRWSEIAERTGRQMHPTVQFDRFEWLDEPRVGTLDRDAAALLVSMLGLQTSTPNVCWLAIWYGYGHLSSGGSSVGVFVSQKAGPRDCLNSHQIKPPRDLANVQRLALPAREYYLYRGPIDVVPRFDYPAMISLQTPNMWWPDDRAWFVATEIDFDSTLIGCSRACAHVLLESDLETLEVFADSRLDFAGDAMNTQP